MNEYQRETAFLRYIITFDETPECQDLQWRIMQVRHDGRCVQGATSLMVLITVLAAAALAYGVIVQEDFPYARSQLVINVICGLGSASLISLAFLSGPLMAYRRKLNRFREECRRLVTKFLEFHLGRPGPASLDEGSHLEARDREVAHRFPLLKEQTP